MSQPRPALLKKDVGTGLAAVQLGEFVLKKRSVEVWEAVKALPGSEVGRSAYYSFQKDWL